MLTSVSVGHGSADFRIQIWLMACPPHSSLREQCANRKVVLPQSTTILPSSTSPSSREWRTSPTGGLILVHRLAHCHQLIQHPIPLSAHCSPAGPFPHSHCSDPLIAAGSSVISSLFLWPPNLSIYKIAAPGRAIQAKAPFLAPKILQFCSRKA